MRDVDIWVLVLLFIKKLCGIKLKMREETYRFPRSDCCDTCDAPQFVKEKKIPPIIEYMDVVPFLKLVLLMLKIVLL